MPTFAYEAFTKDGRPKKGVAPAASRADLLRQLQRQGLLVTSAVPATSNDTVVRENEDVVDRSWSLRSPNIEDYARVARELASLSGAGIPVIEALLLTAEHQDRSSPNRRLLLAVHDAVAQGIAVSQALERSHYSVPRVLVSLVVAGEARGDLATALGEAAEFLEQKSALETKFRSALIYPLVLLVLAVVAVSIILFFLVPSLLPLFEGTGIEPPLVLSAAHDLIAFLSDYWKIIVLLGCACLTLSLVASRTPRVQLLCAEVSLRLPLLGRTLRQRNVALFARTLGTLLRSGVVMPTAIATAGRVMTNQVLVNATDRVLEDVNGGERLSNAIEITGAFTSLFVRFVAVGEQSGRLGETLMQFADMTDAAVERSIERLMSLLAPALTITIGLFVGGLILSVLQAILSVNNLALQ